MSPQLASIVASILGAQARIEGMKAENDARLGRGDAPAYGEDVFFAEAHYLDVLSTEARSCQS